MKVQTFHNLNVMTVTAYGEALEDMAAQAEAERKKTAAVAAQLASVVEAANAVIDRWVSMRGDSPNAEMNDSVVALRRAIGERRK